MRLFSISHKEARKGEKKIVFFVGFQVKRDSSNRIYLRFGGFNLDFVEKDERNGGISK